MKSALFVDFDNVYSALHSLDPVVAERFAFQPSNWMHWLTDSLKAPPHAPDEAARRLLVRRVYLNPQVYQRFRPSFNRAGFEIIDCPPMTSKGKTSTDIHMVLDVVDLLQHEVHYDEFIVFSADADFTPLLRKLRRSDRRTTVLAVGFPSAAYQASADLLIDQDDFIRFGLGFADPEPTPPPAAVVPGRSAADITKDVKALITRYVAESSKAVSLPWLASKALKEVEGLDAASWAGYSSFRKMVEALQLPKLRANWETGTVLDPARHTASAPAPEATVKVVPIDTVFVEVARLIQNELDQVGRPVSCARLAQVIVDRYSALAADWGGMGSFRKFLEALDLGRLEVSWEIGGGQVRDPQAPAVAAPEKPSINRSSDWGKQAHLFPTIQQIHIATGMPLIAPREMQGLLGAVVNEVANQPFALSDTGKRVRDRCREAGLGVSRADVSYVLKGILIAGHEFCTGSDNVPALSNRFIESMRVICAGEQIALDEAAEAALREWSSGAEG